MKNLFLINADNLIINFDFPTNEGISNPQLYLIEGKSREKKMLDMEPNKKEGVRTQVSWKLDTGILEKDLIRLEW